MSAALCKIVQSATKKFGNKRNIKNNQEGKYRWMLERKIMGTRRFKCRGGKGKT